MHLILTTVTGLEFQTWIIVIYFPFIYVPLSHQVHEVMSVKFPHKRLKKVSYSASTVLLVIAQLFTTNWKEKMTMIILTGIGTIAEISKCWLEERTNTSSWYK